MPSLPMCSNTAHLPCGGRGAAGVYVQVDPDMEEVRRRIFKPLLDSPTDSEDQSWRGLLLSKGLQELATEVMSSFHGDGFHR